VKWHTVEQLPSVICTSSYALGQFKHFILLT